MINKTTATIIFFFSIVFFLSNSIIAEWVKVRRVIDGDTFVTDSGEKIRIKNIDTPETKHPRKGTELGGYEAYMLAYNYLKDQMVWLQGNGHDQYRRRVAFVGLQNDCAYEDIVRQNGLDKKYIKTFKYFSFTQLKTNQISPRIKLNNSPQNYSSKMIWVDGYFNKNGTFVSGHWKRQMPVQRSSSSQLNSIYPISTPSSFNIGNKIRVKGYYRKNGTYVSPYYRKKHKR